MGSGVVPNQAGPDGGPVEHAGPALGPHRSHQGMGPDDGRSGSDDLDGEPGIVADLDRGAGRRGVLGRHGSAVRAVHAAGRRARDRAGCRALRRRSSGPRGGSRCVGSRGRSRGPARPCRWAWASGTIGSASPCQKRIGTVMSARSKPHGLLKSRMSKNTEWSPRVLPWAMSSRNMSFISGRANTARSPSGKSGWRVRRPATPRVSAPERSHRRRCPAGHERVGWHAGTVGRVGSSLPRVLRPRGGSDTTEDGTGDHSVRVSRSAGEHIRAAAGQADCRVVPDPEVVQKDGHVVGPVQDLIVEMGGRVARPRTFDADQSYVPAVGQASHLGGKLPSGAGGRRGTTARSGPLPRRTRRNRESGHRGGSRCLPHGEVERVPLP